MSTSAARTVRSVQGDTLSAIVWRHTGTSRGIEQVLDANPQLAHMPAVLPAGVAIELPAAPQAANKPASVSLWD